MNELYQRDQACSVNNSLFLPKRWFTIALPEISARGASLATEPINLLYSVKIGFLQKQFFVFLGRFWMKIKQIVCRKVVLFFR